MITCLPSEMVIRDIAGVMPLDKRRNEDILAKLVSPYGRPVATEMT